MSTMGSNYCSSGETLLYGMPSKPSEQATFSVTVLPSTILYSGGHPSSVFFHPNCYAILSEPIAYLLQKTEKVQDTVVVLGLFLEGSSLVEQFVAWRPTDIIPKNYRLQQDAFCNDIVSRAKKKLQQYQEGEGVKDEEISTLLEMVDALQRMDDSGANLHLMLLSEPFLRSLHLQPGDLLRVKAFPVDQEKQVIRQAELTPVTASDYELLEDQAAYVEVWLSEVVLVVPEFCFSCLRSKFRPLS